mgnify:CR=1 FL=1
MALLSKTNMDTQNKYLHTLPFFREEKAQKFIGITLTLLALSFFGLFAINPTLSTIAKLRKEIDDNKFVNNQLGKKIGDLNRLKQQYANIQNDLMIVFEALPQKADVPLLIAQIQSIAQTTNINIKKIENFEVELLSPNPNKKKGKEHFSYLFSIDGSGTYENISQFISTLTNMQRVIVVDLFSLGKSGVNDSSIEFTTKAMAFIKE